MTIISDSDDYLHMYTCDTKLFPANNRYIVLISITDRILR